MAARGGGPGRRPLVTNAAEPRGVAPVGVLGRHPRPRAPQRYGSRERHEGCRVLSCSVVFCPCSRAWLSCSPKKIPADTARSFPAICEGKKKDCRLHLVSRVRAWSRGHGQ